MICNQCGRILRDDATFCDHCGAPQSPVKQTPVQQTEQTVSAVPLAPRSMPQSEQTVAVTPSASQGEQTIAVMPSSAQQPQYVQPQPQYAPPVPPVHPPMPQPWTQPAPDAPVLLTRKQAWRYAFVAPISLLLLSLSVIAVNLICDFVLWKGGFYSDDYESMEAYEAALSKYYLWDTVLDLLPLIVSVLLLLAVLFFPRQRRKQFLPLAFLGPGLSFCAGAMSNVIRDVLDLAGVEFEYKWYVFYPVVSVLFAVVAFFVSKKFLRALHGVGRVTWQPSVGKKIAVFFLSLCVAAVYVWGFKLASLLIKDSPTNYDDENYWIEEDIVWNQRWLLTSVVRMLFIALFILFIFLIFRAKDRRQSLRLQLVSTIPLALLTVAGNVYDLIYTYAFDVRNMEWTERTNDILALSLYLVALIVATVLASVYLNAATKAPAPFVYAPPANPYAPQQNPVPPQPQYAPQQNRTPPPANSYAPQQNPTPPRPNV